MPSARKQVGGMQEAFIQLGGRGANAVDRAIRAIEKAGGQVLHAVPPRIVVARIPAGTDDELVGKGGITSVDTDAIRVTRSTRADHELSIALAAWNDYVSPERTLRALRNPVADLAWDKAPNRLPLHPPPEVIRELRAREAEIAPVVRGAPATRGINMGIPVLVGRVAVGVVFVDSTVATYAISNDEKSKIVSEITAGLNMLSAFEPRAGVQWFYDFKRPKISLAASKFTEATKSSWEDYWRDAALQAMGYAGSLAGMNQYIADIKAAHSAQHAFALFVTKYPKTWFAYVWGNHAVMDFTVDGWGVDNFDRVLAHETGHIFGCPDEYGSANCNCTGLFGRYQIANGNCETCASPFVPCLMASNTPALCDYTRGHLGWNELALQSKGTTSLKGTWTFDLDTGVQGPPSGSDLWWQQVNTVTRYLVPQSGAMLAHMGKPNFDAVSLQTLQTQPYTATPMNGSNNTGNKLTAGTVIAIRTSAGRYAKLKIDSYGYNLGITWRTYK